MPDRMRKVLNVTRSFSKKGWGLFLLAIGGLSISSWSIRAGVVCGLILVASLLWWVPRVQVGHLSDELSPKDRFQLENEARKTLAQMLGGILVLVGVYQAIKTLGVSEERLRLSESQQFTSGLTQAVQHLAATDENGKPVLELRLGGIYALERLAQDSEQDHWPIMEILTAYVRRNSPANYVNWVPIKGVGPKDRPDPSYGERRSGNCSIRSDIQAVMTVLGRRQADREKQDNAKVLDLSEADLSCAHLFKANLRRASFFGSDLSYTRFHSVDLSRSTFITANLTETFWTDIDLTGADFTTAVLTRAFTLGPELGGLVDLSGVDLSHSIGLVQDEIDRAKGDEETKLPPGLTRPEHWSKHD